MKTALALISVLLVAYGSYMSGVMSQHGKNREEMKRTANDCIKELEVKLNDNTYLDGKLPQLATIESELVQLILEGSVYECLSEKLQLRENTSR